jgi:hypothetical protein
MRVAAIEELVASAGRVVFEGGGEAVYEVDAASLKRLDWLPVSDVAARAVVVKGGIRIYLRDRCLQTPKLPPRPKSP